MTQDSVEQSWVPDVVPEREEKSVKVYSIAKATLLWGSTVKGPVWWSLWVVSVGAAFFYVLMEWVFFVTKPSFMNTLTGWERMQVLVLSPLPLIVLSAMGCGALSLLARGLRESRGIGVGMGLLWPGLIVAASFFLLMDNFTYTLFRVGVQTSSGFWRYGYMAAFGLFFVWGCRVCMAVVKWLLKARKAKVLGLSVSFVLTLSWGFLLAPFTDRLEGRFFGGATMAAKDLPNIVLIASDGVSADHLSVYGYERETTPYLRAFAEKQGLICENAFANAINSGSSIASMLTGKLPTVLRLYYPPEILTGRNAYEHLPGILRGYGYENVDISIRQFGDAYDLNMLHSFHEANGRREKGRNLASTWLGMNTGYFLGVTWERLTDRLLHAAGVKDFESAYNIVMGEVETTKQNDKPQIDRLVRLIESRRERPLFVHVHLMKTHGPMFFPQTRVFSRGRNQTEDFERDFYDDVIRDLDAAFERIIRALEEKGQLDKTILIFSSDHGKMWKMTRIPLIFRFPGGAHAGKIRTNTQNVDIAPTVLDYLGITKPEWMGGISLLRGEPPEKRPIFFAAVNDLAVDPKKWMLDESRLNPPFYSLGVVGMVIGDRTYLLNLVSGTLTTDFVRGHTCPMGEEEVMTLVESGEILFRHLEENGYKVPGSWRIPGGELP